MRRGVALVFLCVLLHPSPVSLQETLAGAVALRVRVYQVAAGTVDAAADQRLFMENATAPFRAVVRRLALSRRLKPGFGGSQSSSIAGARAVDRTHPGPGWRRHPADRPHRLCGQSGKCTALRGCFGCIVSRAQPRRFARPESGLWVRLGMSICRCVAALCCTLV